MKFYAIDPIVWKVVAGGAGLPPVHEAVLAEHAVATHLVRPLSNTWADLGSLDRLPQYHLPVLIPAFHGACPGLLRGATTEE